MAAIYPGPQRGGNGQAGDCWSNGRGAHEDKEEEGRERRGAGEKIDYCYLFCEWPTANGIVGTTRSMFGSAKVFWDQTVLGLSVGLATTSLGGAHSATYSIADPCLPREEG